MARRPVTASQQVTARVSAGAATTTAATGAATTPRAVASLAILATRGSSGPTRAGTTARGAAHSPTRVAAATTTTAVAVATGTGSATATGAVVSAAARPNR